MTEVNPSLLVVSLNVNGLNSLVKRHKLAKWIKNMIQLYAVYEHLTSDPKTQKD